MTSANKPRVFSPIFSLIMQFQVHFYSKGKKQIKAVVATPESFIDVKYQIFLKFYPVWANEFLKIFNWRFEYFETVYWFIFRYFLSCAALFVNTNVRLCSGCVLSFFYYFLIEKRSRNGNFGTLNLWALIYSMYRPLAIDFLLTLLGNQIQFYSIFVQAYIPWMEIFSISKFSIASQKSFALVYSL